MVAPEDSEHTASGFRKVEIRKMQKMSSEDSEYAENVLGDSEYAENVLGGFGTYRKWLRRFKIRKMASENKRVNEASLFLRTSDDRPTRLCVVFPVSCWSTIITYYIIKDSFDSLSPCPF